MAFRVIAGPKTQAPIRELVCVSIDMDMRDPAVIANGVGFAPSTGSNEDQSGGTEKRILKGHPAALKAFDLKTGKELFNSGNAVTSWVRFS
jgi:arginase family enzyme